MVEPTLSLLQEQNRRLTEERDALKFAGGGGTSGGMDPWQTSVESRLGHLQSGQDRLSDKVDRLGDKIDSNLKWSIGGFVVVTGALASGYLLLADKLDALLR